MRVIALACVASFALACADAPVTAPIDVQSIRDASSSAVDSADAAVARLDGTDVDLGARATPECQWGGAAGSCMTAAACVATTDHSAEPGTCPAAQQCCIDTPDVTDNPPFPVGYKLMTQAQVTPAMTAWAVMILHDPVTYPMYATTTRLFGALMVLAQVEWHPPDFQNSVVHRGVTLFVPR